MPRPRRPRPIPPNPDGLNEQRSQWADTAIATFMQVTGTGFGVAVAYLLCDLKHWCDRHNISFMQELRRAEGMYRDETRAGTTRAEVRADPEAPTPYTPTDDEPIF